LAALILLFLIFFFLNHSIITFAFCWCYLFYSYTCQAGTYRRNNK